MPVPGAEQRPATHTWPVAQRVPQPPQLKGSMVVVAQYAPHDTCGAAHRAGATGSKPPSPRTMGAPQRLATHTWPAAQRAPQRPQLKGSVVVVAQYAPHDTCGATHRAGVTGSGPPSPPAVGGALRPGPAVAQRPAAQI